MTELKSIMANLIGKSIKSVSFYGYNYSEYLDIREWASLKLGLVMEFGDYRISIKGDYELGFSEDEEGFIHYEYDISNNDLGIKADFTLNVNSDRILRIDCYQADIPNMIGPLDCPVLIFLTDNKRYTILFNTTVPKFSFFELDYLRDKRAPLVDSYNLVFSIT